MCVYRIFGVDYVGVYILLDEKWPKLGGAVNIFGWKCDYMSM